MRHWLFSYGTLGQPEVQRALFGQVVPTTEDELPGHQLDWVAIIDPHVVALSGSDRHPIVSLGGAADVVPGRCLELDDAQLAAADAYEVDDYRRIEVVLASGRRAWVYTAAENASGGEELGEP